MSNVLKGFNSQSWVDRNSDNVSTSVRLDNCRVSPTSGGDKWVYMSLQREIPFWPDTGMGNRMFICTNSSTQSWGDVEAADYHFWVKDFGDNGGSRYYLSSNFVRIKW